MTKAIDYSKYKHTTECCNAPILLKQTGMGIFCSKCKKEVFQTVLSRK